MEDIRQTYIAELSKRLCEITRVGFFSHLSRNVHAWTGAPKNPEDLIVASDINGRCTIDITARLGSQKIIVRGVDGRILCSYSTNNGVGVLVGNNGDSQNISLKEAVIEVLRAIYMENGGYD
ncbi:hypothetical protein HY487_01075 [Candidatus Woesearchaeota archaeon]|nr:hypothetical protein [Candidatus Woesearchaeota archaeon]